MSSDIKVVVDYSDLTGLIKTSEQTEKALSLVARTFAKTNDQKAYMAGINKIVQAQSQLDKKSRMSRAQIMKLGASMRQEAQFAEELARATQEASTHINAMGKSSNRAGVAMQQTGYQVGDFLVQVQSGTNPMVAFGQQATQLVGIMYLLPQATLAAKISILGLSVSMAGLTMGLSIIIPLLTAMGAAFMRSGNRGKDFNEILGDLSTSFDSYISAASGANTTTEALLETYGRVTPELIELEERLQALQLRQVALDAREAANALSEYSFGDWNPFTANLDEIRNAFDTTNDRARVLQRALKAVGDADGPEQVLEALQTLSEQATEAAGGVGNLTAEQIAFISQVTETEKQFQQLVNILGVVDQAQQRVNETQEKNYEAFDAHIKEHQKYLDRIEKANLSAEESLRLEEQKLELLRIERSFGKESLTYSTMVGVQEDLNVRKKLEALGVAEDIIAATIENLRNQRLLTAEIEKQSEMEGSAGGQMLRRYGSRATTSNKPPMFGDGTSIYDDDPPKTKTLRDPLKKIRERLALDQQLLGTSKERQKVMRAIANSDVKYKEEAVNRVIAELEAYNELIAGQKALQDMYEDTANVMGSAFENSFMSIIDGTQSVKEAFKAMAADIVKHLFKVLVVQKMVRSFGGAMSGSSSSIISGLGGALSSYGGGVANGGPVQAGRSYTVGERGPEIFTPATAGNITPNSQTGGSGVTVVQNINVSTGVQQTVRAEIRQMMPQIAESAKGAVVDAKRRGGNYGKAFA